MVSMNAVDTHSAGCSVMRSESVSRGMASIDIDWFRSTTSAGGNRQWRHQLTTVGMRPV